MSPLRSNPSQPTVEGGVARVVSEITDDSRLDGCPDRRGSDSIKWTLYGPSVLPLWVADMDVTSPKAVIEALTTRVQHGVFGYGTESRQLTELLAERLRALYDWHVEPDAIVLLPGVMPGVNLACRIATQAGASIAIQTPVYPPIRRVASEVDRRSVEIEFSRDERGRASIDWDKFSAGIAEARMLILCNPQNPTGRVFEVDELLRMGHECVRRGLVICSDEIHADLVHAGSRHVPIATLDPEIASTTITLMAPSKTFNLAGLGCAFAVIPDRGLRSRFKRARGSLVPHVNALATVAALAAYREGAPWLDSVRHQLFERRQQLTTYLQQHLPEVRFYPPEGTYLAWLDFGPAQLGKRPFDFFLQEASVALSDGALFGGNGSSCVRLNFGCSEQTLREALDRMREAVARSRAARRERHQ